jgi:hypothetical protein
MSAGRCHRGLKMGEYDFPNLTTILVCSKCKASRWKMVSFLKKVGSLCRTFGCTDKGFQGKNQVEPRKTEVRAIICRMHEIPGIAGTSFDT